VFKTVYVTSIQPKNTDLESYKRVLVVKVTFKVAARLTADPHSYITATDVA